MRNSLLLFIVLAIIIFSCKDKESVDPVAETKNNYGDFITFKFEAKYNPKQLLEDIVCQIDTNQITGTIPYTSNAESLIASFTSSKEVTVKVNGVIQESGITPNNFTQPVIYTVEAPNGSVREYKIQLHTFTGLPVLYITTENKTAITSKDTYVKGHLKIDANAQFTKGLYNGEIEIRGRGNTTWEMPKKPFKIKLNKKEQLLDMPADKEWALLANYADKSLMRNYLAFELSRRFGLSYTPQSRFVEVFLNGEYMGNYLLTEQIKVSADRVNIKEMGKNDISGEALTGGYLLEVDQRLDEDYWFRTNLGVPFAIKSPEDITPEQFDYIKNYVILTENAIHNVPFDDPDEGYTHYLNVETFINWYLVNELLKNNDAGFYSSVFMYKDRNSKLSMGPVWDFDISLGNVNYNNNSEPDGWNLRNAVWIKGLFQDPDFRKKVTDRWNELKAKEIESLFSFINQTAFYLKQSQKENFEKWDILDNYTWPNSVVMGSYENEVQYLKSWLSKRIDWMDAELNIAQ